MTVIRRLQTFRLLHACSGCFRLERSPGGACTRWKSAALSRRDAAMMDRIQALIADLDAYATRGMKAFDAPGRAIGIVAGDKLVYAKGFGVRSKGGGQPVDARTIFQIGSTTKAFLATSLAIMVDRGKLNWDDRVVDLYPAFQLKDPWVTREFRRRWRNWRISAFCKDSI